MHMGNHMSLHLRLRVEVQVPLRLAVYLVLGLTPPSVGFTDLLSVVAFEVQFVSALSVLCVCCCGISGNECHTANLWLWLCEN